MLVVFPGRDHMLRKVRKSRYAAVNGTGPGASGPGPDLPRCVTHPAMPPLLGPARAPARHPSRNEPEIALRDPHSLAVCGRNPQRNSARHVNASQPYQSPAPRHFPDSRLPPHFTLAPLPRTPARRPARRLPDALPNAMKPGFHCAGTHWIRGFIAFELAPRSREGRPRPRVRPRRTRCPRGRAARSNGPARLRSPRRRWLPPPRVVPPSPTSAACVARPAPRGRPPGRRGAPGS
jgi:hypothetical protein